MPFAQPGQSIVWRGGRRVVVGGVAAGPPPGKTYAQFVTHITGLSTGVNTWGGSVGGSGAGPRITTAAAATGAMYGTPWNSWAAMSAATCRVVQHALPSEAEFNAQIAAGRSILMQMVSVENQLLSGINRNGYTSLSEGTEGADAANCTQILFWSGTDTGGSAFSMNPSTGTGPTPYTW